MTVGTQNNQPTKSLEIRADRDWVSMKMQTRSVLDYLDLLLLWSNGNSETDCIIHMYKLCFA